MSALKNNKIQIIKYSPPPPELPVLGDMDPKEVSFIGRTNYVAALEEKKYVFGIKRLDRRRHLYIIGKSGVGKTKLNELMIRQDIAYGYGVCLIDTHGELIEEILNFIPEERIGDVCIINPADTKNPVYFNPLSDVKNGARHQIAQSFIEILKKHFTSNWTPKLEHTFRFTILALMDYPNATMRGIISMLTEENYRLDVMNYIQDDMVKKFWEMEFPEWSTKFDSEIIIPLVNKISQFLSDPMLRNIFDQVENKIDFENLMNQNKIILINLAKDIIGEENSSIFGSIILAKIKQAGMTRSKNRENLKDIYLYIEDFPNLVTETFENMISESKKYGFCLTISHQYISQLQPKTQQIVMGNIGSIITFRIGGDDAIKLKPEYAPIFDVKDMINLGVGEFYIKMTIDDESYDPFSAETLKVLAPTHRSYKNETVELSRLKYATPIE
jgi:type IV secretory pathway TraG/TraD family ATPase VirD4